MPKCPFCDYSGPSDVIYDERGVIVFEPLSPVTTGHLLVVPKEHMSDLRDAPMDVLAEVMAVVADFASAAGQCNVITSCGPLATQTVKHLHWHIVPRRKGDGLALPWTSEGFEG